MKQNIILKALIIGVLPFLGVAALSRAVPVQVLAELEFDPPSGEVNILPMMVTIEQYSLGSDTAEPTLSGSIRALLDIDYDPGAMTATVTGLTILSEGSEVETSDVSFSHTTIFNTGVDTTGEGLGGVLSTPNPPGPVEADGTFSTADHVILLNRGQFWSQGTGLASSIDIEINLEEEPVEVTSETRGTVELGEVAAVNGKVTAPVSISIPVEYEGTLVESEPGSLLPPVTLHIVGTVRASGEIAFTPPIADADEDGIDDKWEIDFFGVAGAEADADAEGDGISNFLEYALSASPLESSLGSLPEPVLLTEAGGKLALRFTRPTDSAHLAYGLEASTDAKAWTHINPAETEVTVEAEADGRQTVVVSPAGEAGSDSVQFLRLRVSPPNLE